MKLRPTIFLSGVSSEFASFRDAAEIEIQKKGCFPLNQPSFEIDYREIEEILRRKLREADAVIHIAGFRFGLEPKNRPADRPRRSYTQLEYDIARDLNIPVYVFLSADANVRDPNPGEQPEDAEAIELQLAHRQALQRANNIRYSINDKNHLCALVAGIPLLATADFRVDISRIVEYAPAELIGREDELALLNDAWLKVRRAESRRPHILTFVALGGEGKTSLVAKWLADLAYENWPGCDSAFAWSFYSQGTREQYAASSDLFLKGAITFFGNEADKQFAASNAGAYEKGQRLARIVGQRRSLLILDGLEPLQYAPTSPTPGELKDAGVLALLKSLAADSDGLCIVTTRYSLPNLKAFWQTTAPEVKLLRLSTRAGVHLLKTFGVNGRVNEFETLVQDVKGHALTLNLLGTYLRDAHGGDIRRRDLVKLGEADAEEQGGHAFRVMEAYERAFEEEGDRGKRALATLQLLGLFDRPITADCLDALLDKPAIPDVTDLIVGLSEAQRNVVFKRLEDAKVLTVNRESSGALISLDAHPLIREYFAQQLLKQQLAAWRAGHQRIYKHLCMTTPDKLQPTLEDLQPLYQAVVHGCQAGLPEETFYEVYISRITRGEERYVIRKLGAFASDLGALAYFFEQPWSRVLPRLSEEEQALILNQAAFRLRALGRLTEALEPMRGSISINVKNENWELAAITASSLSELSLITGKVTDAVKDAEQTIFYADKCSKEFQLQISRSVYADALHQANRRGEAEARFREAEQIQKKWQPPYPMLYSMGGFRYCDLLLSDAERAAWRRTLNDSDNARHSEVLTSVSERVTQTLGWIKGKLGILDEAMEHLTLSRATLYKAVLASAGLPVRIEGSKVMFEVTVEGLRRAGATHHLPRGLLTRAWLRFLDGKRTGGQSAHEDLDEAWEIAERGPMKLHMTDIHLYRARLFFRENEYPWESPRADLDAAEKLINECGYHRRDEELADAKRVICA